jgi:hypothetical protein
LSIVAAGALSQVIAATSSGAREMTGTTVRNCTLRQRPRRTLAYGPATCSLTMRRAAAHAGRRRTRCAVISSGNR